MVFTHGEVMQAYRLIEAYPDDRTLMADLLVADRESPIRNGKILWT